MSRKHFKAMADMLADALHFGELPQALERPLIKLAEQYFRQFNARFDAARFERAIEKRRRYLESLRNKAAA